jgi:thioesterase domain-containing protein/acyl carrier protein
MYKTGDLCRQRENGAIEYLGRLDQQIKIRGFRIELAEIEVALERHPSVAKALTAVRSVNEQPAIVAYVIATESNKAKFSVKDLQTYLQQILPGYMQPQTVVLLDEFPLNANGKIDRNALPAPNTQHVSSPRAPQDKWEFVLLEICKKILGVAAIGVSDNFFNVGGNSLLAVRLVSEIQKVTGKEIPLATLFQDATIERLASVLRQGNGVDHKTVRAVQENGWKPPFFGIVTPGMNGLGFIALARHLGNDQPVYTIQGPGARVRNRPYTPAEFEALAADYIAAMKTVQPQGPYFLGGMCEGARIAFDMARLLEARGEEVAVLAIFDTWVLENSQIRALWKLDYYGARVKWFWQRSRRDKLALIRRWFQRRSTQRAPRPWATTYWPGKNFIPGKIRADVSLLKLPKQPYFYVRDPEMGWGSRTTGKVNVHSVPVKAKRHNLLFREPCVRELARQLRSCLQSAVAGQEFELMLSSTDRFSQTVICQADPHS